MTPSSRSAYHRRSFLKSMAALPALPAAYAAQTSGARGKTTRMDGEIQEYRDKETGARVVRLTGPDSDNVHLYFTSESFVSGSDRIVFGSNRSGSYQLYLLEIRDKRLVQLTDSDKVAPTSCCMAGGVLNYFQGATLRSLRLDNLDDREVYRVPDGWQQQLSTCTADGKFVAFAYREKLNVSTETGRIYSTMAETFYQRPACVIMRVDTGTGDAVAAWGERAWISHVLIHPKNPDLILFCHEGGSHSLQRMWTVNMASVRGRKAEPLYPQKPNEYCVHEYFTRAGEIGFQYEVERQGQIEHYNCFVRPDGTWLRQYLLPGRRPGHIQSNTANTLVIGDCGYLARDDKDGARYMALYTHNNGQAQVRRLCSRVPGETQYSHGHPVFSLDDRWVIYNSRIGKREGIFMAEVGSI